MAFARDLIWFIAILVIVLILIPIIRPVYVLKRDEYGRIINRLSFWAYMAWTIIVTLILFLIYMLTLHRTYDTYLM